MNLPVLEEVRASLNDVLYRDRREIERTLEQAARRLAQGQPADRLIDRARARAAESRDEVQRRRTSVLVRELAADLPVSACAEDIESAVRSHPVTVVCGETGSGKTTQLPKILARMGYGTRGRIGHTQPRRIAARSVSARIAEELGVPLGQDVGYQVRFDKRVTDATRIKLMTDGILLAETQDDPDLLQYDALIIDEAHERSLNVDFLLGYLHRLLERRPELKVVITSATIDPERFSRHFDDAPIILASGRTYPVELRYRPPEPVKEIVPELSAQIVSAVESIDHEDDGDVLVFLPTERDIRETRVALEDRFAGRFDLVPLFARLPVPDQQRIFAPHEKRRIVLATNVAETSLTVPGIRYVIDSGLARISRFSPRSQVQRLPIEAISQASARQRSGRAGRIEAGVCIRLYSEEDHDRRDAFTAPEIQRTHLASVILQMKALGLGEPEHFPFVDPPEPRRVRAGYDTLYELGAVDPDGELTEIGRDLSLLPVDPRLGRMLVAAHHGNCLREVCVLVAALSISDPRDRPHEERARADQAHQAFAVPDSDHATLLKLWRAFQSQREALSSRKLRQWCRKQFLNHARMREWQDLHRQIVEQLAEAGIERNEGPAPRDAVHRALLAGLLGNIGQREGNWAYRGARGGRFWLWPGSALAERPPKWVVCAEHVETNRRYGRIAAPIQPKWIEPYAEHLLRRSYVDPYWHAARGHVYAYENANLYDLQVVHRKRVAYEAIDPLRSREIFIRQALVHGDIRTRMPFHRHNRELIEGLTERLERSRRTELLCSGDDLFAWYDARIPGDIANTRNMEQWYRRTSEEDPRLLHLEEADLLLEPEALPEAALFPDEMQFSGEAFRLTWHYEPGAERDGASIDTPRHRVAHLQPAVLDWLVPGLLEEKVTELLRTLPKALRRSLVPLPDTARRLVQRLRFREGPLLDLLAQHVREISGTPVRSVDFQPDRLPPHLVFGVRLVDEDGREVAFHRDLATLRATLADTPQASQPQGKRPPRPGTVHTRWDMGEVPYESEQTLSGLRVRIWPVLRDVGHGVRVDALDTPDLAEAVHAAGVRRLLALAHRKQILRELDRRTDCTRVRLSAACLPMPEEFEPGFTARAVHHALDGTTAWPREADAFAALDGVCRAKLGRAIDDVLQTVAVLLPAYEDVARKLQIDAPPIVQPAIADMMEQLAMLLGPGFWIDTPVAWFRRLPRFLDAIDRRLVRLGQGGLAKDTERMRQFAPHWKRFVARREELGPLAVVDEGLTTYRWMLEEFRVSLFAQELKTSMPISVKRLEKQWERVRFR